MPKVEEPSQLKKYLNLLRTDLQNRSAMNTNNYASKGEGAKLVDFSSELEGCDACHVLDPNLANIWLSEEGLPQWLCISLDGVRDKRDLVIRTIGWHCWHPYTTNPKEVTVHVSSDGAKFKIWDTFYAQQSKGTQLFCCAPISASIYPYVALEVVQTFGGLQTYMNRVYFYCEEIPTSPPPPGMSASSSSSPQHDAIAHQSRLSYGASPPSKYMQPRHQQLQQQQQQQQHEDPREPRRSGDYHPHSLGADQGLGVSAVVGNASGFPQHQHGAGAGAHRGPNADASFLSDDFGALDLRPMESRLASVERALGWGPGADTHPQFSIESLPPAAALTADQRLAQLEQRLSAVIAHETRKSAEFPTGPGTADDKHNSDEDDTTSSFSSLDTDRSGAPIFPEQTQPPERGNRQGRTEQTARGAAGHTHTHNQSRSRSRGRGRGSRHDSRFAKAIQGIEGLVANVLERVEERHTLAVKAVAGMKMGESDDNHGNGIGSGAERGGKVRGQGAAAPPTPPPTRVGVVKSDSAGAARSESARRGATALGPETESGTTSPPLPELPPPLNLAGIRAECFGVPDWQLLGAPNPTGNASSRSRSRSPPPRHSTESTFHQHPGLAASAEDTIVSVGGDTEIAAIVARLHEAVLRRTYKEAQLQLLLGRSASALASIEASGAPFSSPLWSPQYHTRARSFFQPSPEFGEQGGRRRPQGVASYTASLPRFAQATESVARKKAPSSTKPGVVHTKRRGKPAAAAGGDRSKQQARI